MWEQRKDLFSPGPVIGSLTQKKHNKKVYREFWGGCDMHPLKFDRVLDLLSPLLERYTEESDWSCP
jgi:type VI protein secretion system component Hcp